MTAAAVSAAIVAPHPPWRSLLWIVPLTGVWILLIYWQPIIPASGVPTTAHQLMAHAFIAVGLWLGLESTDLTPGQRRTTWLAVMIPDTLWFAVAITLGMITSPGRFQVIVPNVQSIGAGAYPEVLTPAFVVPSSILLHALSLRQLIRRRAG